MQVARKVREDGKAPLALDAEPILYEQLEPGDLVVIELAAVGNNIPDFVELGQNLLHGLLASEGVGEIGPVRVKDADEFAEVEAKSLEIIQGIGATSAIETL